MKATEQDWINATANLNIRRQWRGVPENAIKITGASSDYGTYINKCGFGKSILDVGCGAQHLKECLPDGFDYIGLDAFPLSGIDCINTPIEQLTGLKVDTVVAFAVLDNCLDFDKACEVMIEAANLNIIILTSIGVKIDKFHTFELNHRDFKMAFKSCTLTYAEEISNKVWLLNYQK